jgi:hypothetical protein
MGWTAEVSEFDPGTGKIFLISTSSKPLLEPAKPPMEWVIVNIPRGAKCLLKKYVDLYISHAQGQFYVLPILIDRKESKGKVLLVVMIFLTSAQDGGKWSASRLFCFVPRERALGTHWTRGCMGPGVGMDAVEYKISHVPARNRTWAVQSIAHCFTD